MEAITERRCQKCGVVKPIENFSRSQQKYDRGFTRTCKQCWQEYRKAHKEELRQANKTWRIENAERLKQYKKDHRQRDYFTEIKLKALHPHRNKLKIASRRARKFNAVNTFTEAEWIEILEKYHHQCLRCGANGELEIDHVLPLSKGGSNTAGNIQPLCPACNGSKLDRYIDYRPDKEFFITPEILELGRLANSAPPSRSLPGAKNPTAKLTEENVIEIINNKTLSTREMANKLRVSVGTVNRIEAGRGWAHIPRPNDAAL